MDGASVCINQISKVYRTSAPTSFSILLSHISATRAFVPYHLSLSFSFVILNMSSEQSTWTFVSKDFPTHPVHLSINLARNKNNLSTFFEFFSSRISRSPPSTNSPFSVSQFPSLKSDHAPQECIIFFDC